MLVDRAKFTYCFFGGVLSILISILAKASSSLVLLFCAIAIFLFSLKYIRCLIKYLLDPLYLSIVVLLLLATINAVFLFDLEWNFWQVLRAQFWTLLAFPLALTARKAALINLQNKKHTKVLFFVVGFCLMSALNSVVDFALNTGFAPAYINNENRIYPVAALFVPGFLIFSIVAKEYLLAIALLIVSVITMGKLYLLLVLYSLLCSFVILFDWRRFTTTKELVIKKTAGLLVVITLVVAPILYATQADRVAKFLESGDTSREKQSFQVIQAISDVGFSSIYGLGIGTKIIEGNYTNTDTSTGGPSKALLINSQYDVEVGFMHLFARFGIFGSLLLFCYCLKGFKKSKLIFIGYSSIFLLGASWSGIAHVFSLLLYGWSIGWIEGMAKDGGFNYKPWKLQY